MKSEAALRLQVGSRQHGNGGRAPAPHLQAAQAQLVWMMLHIVIRLLATPGLIGGWHAPAAVDADFLNCAVLREQRRQLFFCDVLWGACKK